MNEIFNGGVDITSYTCKENEYIENETLYCAKCKTEKMFKIPNTTRGMIALCKCEQEKRAEQEKLEQLENAKIRLKNLQATSFMDTRYNNARFGNTDLKRSDSFVNAFNKCESFVNNWGKIKNESCGLYLYGNTGGGKTHLASCVANEIMSLGYQVEVTSFNILRQRQFNKSIDMEREIKRLAQVPLLIIDDIGTTQIKSDGDITNIEELIYSIINARYNAKKPIIFSSNLNLNELAQTFNGADRIIQRIAEMATYVLEIKDETYRKKLVNKNLF